MKTEEEILEKIKHLNEDKASIDKTIEELKSKGHTIPDDDRLISKKGQIEGDIFVLSWVLS